MSPSTRKSRNTMASPPSSSRPLSVADLGGSAAIHSRPQTPADKRSSTRKTAQARKRAMKLPTSKGCATSNNSHGDGDADSEILDEHYDSEDGDEPEVMAPSIDHEKLYQWTGSSKATSSVIRDNNASKKRTFSEALSHEPTPDPVTRCSSGRSVPSAHKRINSGMESHPPEDSSAESEDSDNVGDEEPVPNDDDILAGILDDDYDGVNFIFDSEEDETHITQYETKIMLEESERVRRWSLASATDSNNEQPPGVAELMRGDYLDGFQLRPPPPPARSMPVERMLAPRVRWNEHALGLTLSLMRSPEPENHISAALPDFVPQDNLDPHLRALIEGDDDDTHANSSDEAISSSGTRSPDVHTATGWHKVQSETESEDAENALSGYNSDIGDTTDEDEPSLITPNRPVRQHRHVSHENSQPPMQPRWTSTPSALRPRRGPVRGTWTDHRDKPSLTLAEGGRRMLHFLPGAHCVQQPPNAFGQTTMSPAALRRALHDPTQPLDMSNANGLDVFSPIALDPTDNDWMQPSLRLGASLDPADTARSAKAVSHSSDEDEDEDALNVEDLVTFGSRSSDEDESKTPLSETSNSCASQRSTCCHRPC